MQTKKLSLLLWSVLGPVAALVVTAPLYLVRADASATAARLRRLEDRQAIEELFTAYGATLDRRDFAAFGRLFAEDATYVSGPGEPVRGRRAIQSLLEKTLASNPAHLPEPAFHLFFNPSIEVKGDRATANSKGAYLIPDVKDGGARIVFFVSYEDAFVRQGNQWLFSRREIHAGIPAGAAR